MPKKTKQPNKGLYGDLRQLMERLDRPAPPRRKGPGRPAKNRADTAPVILHLYTSQIRWLDEYAAMVESARPGNVRLSRVEVVRALLLGLARHALEHAIPFPAHVPILSEQDLRHAIAIALNGRSDGEESSHPTQGNRTCNIDSTGTQDGR